MMTPQALLPSLIFFIITLDVVHFSCAYYNCSTSSVTERSPYQINVNSLLSSLLAKANNSKNGFYSVSTPTPPTSNDSVYGLYLCRGDETPLNCRHCVATGVKELRGSCPLAKEAIVWYDECTVFYSNQNISSTVQLSPTLALRESGSATNTTDFSRPVRSTLDKILAEASEKKYVTEEVAISSSQTLHFLVQCTPDLSSGDCCRCLQHVAANLKIDQAGSKSLAPRCNARFELYSFYQAQANRSAGNASAPMCRVVHDAPAMNRSGDHGNDGPHPYIGTRHGRARHIPEITVSSVIVAIILLICALWLFLHKKKAEEASEDVSDILYVESLQMDLNTIRAATQNFAADRKLGQGGFGEVYKGTLENGQDIAVKRLSTNSGQGIAEFKTEVLLVAKLQHRNLVKLLGFCISGKEKILVYEFLPNSSLDKILFDRIKQTTLNWETRLKIISGIAKGLLYLHEDSRLRIVHRDLKSSNILLDEAMNPKVADFGLAKLFGADQSQDATNTIVGTYGYMAPEYILTGHYSMKSDVYAFGIIVLEVVSGQRNKYLNRPQLEEALLHRAWRLWNEGESLNLVDERLGNNYAREDVMKCIHIGLLCIQENVANRPNMTSVVAALGGQSIPLPLPAPPNFFGAPNPAPTVNSGQDATVYGISDISEVDPR